MKIITIIIYLFLTLTASSQRLSSSVISSFGGSMSKSGLYLSHTAGQEGRVDAKNNGSLNLQQGFEKQMISLFGIRNQFQLIDFSLFPNPNRGEFSLSSNQREMNDYNLSVYSVFGKLIYQTNLNYLNQSKVSLPFIASGTYLVKISTPNGGIGNSKFIKY